MMLIRCPFCGERAEWEFTWGGEVERERPADPENCTDGEWSDYLFGRDNVCADHAEYWCHTYGCGQWFTADRDTRSHCFLGTPGA